MTAAMAKRSWNVRRATAEDRAAALQLTERAFKGVAPAADAARIWDWIFVDNPADARMHYLVAAAGDRLAGQYAAMPVRAQHEGKPVMALVSLHTATDPDFERQGIFTTLARQLYAEASTEAPIVFGFPNPNSAPGFFAKLDWVELRPFPALIRPLANLAGVIRDWRPRLARAAEVADLFGPLQRASAWAVSRVERARGAEVVDVPRFDASVDELWSSLSPDLGTCAVRDSRYLNWRFVDSPFAYRRYALIRQGRQAGFAVTATRPWRGGKLSYLAELMVPRGDSAGARLLLAHCVLDAIDDGAAAMYAVATRRHPHRGALLQMGFLPPPASLAAQQCFGVRHNGPGVVANRLFHIDDWYLSGADLDYV